MTKPMTQDSAVAEKVTQAIRDAAADAVKAYRDRKNGDWQQRIRDGKCDAGEMVQAFARIHTAGRLEGVRESIATAEACDIKVPLAPGCPDGATIASQAIFTAIRALLEKHNG